VEELVDLLLVLGHGEPRLGVVDDVGQLFLDGVLVERHRHAAEGLGRGHRPVELGAVVADDRGLVTTGKAERGQSQRDAARAREVIAPRGGLPDAEVLLRMATRLGQRSALARMSFGKVSGTRRRASTRSLSGCCFENSLRWGASEWREFYARGLVMSSKRPL
jgi:hypothetical protein